MRRLTAYWERGLGESVRLGELAELPQQNTRFEWDVDFLQTSYELSPLKFKKTSGLIEIPPSPFHGLPGLFADSVPDGWGNMLLRRGLSLQTLEEASPLDYLAFLSERTRGAITYKPSLRGEEQWATGTVNLDDLKNEIPKILDQSPSALLEQFISGGSGPNGMRPKIVVTEGRDGSLHIGDSPVEGSEWLVKFPSKEDSSDIGPLEYVYSLMAQEAGVEMAETKLMDGQEGRYFATRLFDRQQDGTRLHVHTLSGLLHVPPQNFGVDYVNFAQAARALTKDAREVEKTFRLAVFNAVTINQDDHTKNIAFLMNNDGKWSVAPAYDLTYAPSRFGEHKMLYLGEGRPTAPLLKKLGKELGMKATRVKAIIAQTVEVAERFQALARENEVSRKLITEIAKDIKRRLSDDLARGLDR